MDWHDEVRDAMPRPVPGESPSIRQDIEDELADHLECATSRERVSGHEESVVRGRVLEQFGDLSTVTRQLWFEALKGRLMSHRISLLVGGLVACACLLASGLMWKIARDMQQANRELLSQQEATYRELLNSSARQNRELLESLPRLLDGARSATSPSREWNPLRLHLVLDDASHTPAVGFQVDVQGQLHTPQQEVSLEETSDESGVVDFGVVRPGQCRLTVLTPWRERREWSFNVLPGSVNELQVVCPSAEPAAGSLDVQFEWPDELREQPVGLVAVFHRDARIIEEHGWRTLNRLILLLTPDGQRSAFQDTWHDQQTLRTLHKSLSLYGRGSTSTGALSIPSGSYRLDSLRLIHYDADTAAALEAFDWVNPSGPAPSFTVLEPPDFHVAPSSLPGGFTTGQPEELTLSIAAGETAAVRLSLKTDQVHEALAALYFDRRRDGSPFPNMDPRQWEAASRFYAADINHDGQLSAEELVPLDEALKSRIEDHSQELTIDQFLEIATPAGRSRGSFRR